MMSIRTLALAAITVVALLSAVPAYADSNGYSSTSYSYGSYGGGHSRYHGGGHHGGHRGSYSSGRRYSVPAVSYIRGGRYYNHAYGGPGYNSWGRSANFITVTPHRGTWNQRWNNWEQQERQRQQAMAQAGGPCGIYNRASSAGCRYATMPYLPWVHGDR